MPQISRHASGTMYDEPFGPCPGALKSFSCSINHFNPVRAYLIIFNASNITNENACWGL